MSYEQMLAMNPYYMWIKMLTESGNVEFKAGGMHVYLSGVTIVNNN